jgi:hypothetical protein
MSGPKMCTNVTKLLPGANLSRPSGCDARASALNPLVLMEAMFTGNRATKREALRKTMKQARAWAKTPEGKRFLADREEKS